MKILNTVLIAALCFSALSFGEAAKNDIEVIKIDDVHGDVSKWPPFLAAIRKGDVQQVEKLLKENPKRANAVVRVAKDVWRARSPIIAYAVSLGSDDPKWQLAPQVHVALLELFLKYGAKLRTEIDGVQYFMENQIIQDAVGQSVSWKADDREQYLTKILSLLIKYGAQFNKEDRDYNAWAGVREPDLPFLKAFANNNLVDFNTKYEIYDDKGTLVKKTLLDIANLEYAREIRYLKEAQSSKEYSETDREAIVKRAQEQVNARKAMVDYLESRMKQSK